MSYNELNKIEIAEMNTDRIIDKSAYALNCLTNCPGHKLSWGLIAVHISPGDLIRFE